MGSKEELRRERRAQILEAAIQAFTEKGFGDATMDDIVARAGLSKGTLYWYFESKDELINSIVGYIFERELAHAQQVVQGEERSREKLLVTLEMVTASFEQMQPIMPILMEYWAMMMRDERIRNTIGGYYQEFYEFLRPIIRQGVERGEFHTPDVDAAVYALVALAEGMGILWAADPTKVDLKQSIDKGIRLLIAGLESDE